MAVGLSPAQPVGAGLQPLTMNDRAALYSSMRGRGMTDDEIGAELSRYPLPAPSVPAAEAEADPYVGIAGELRHGIRNTIGNTVGGIGGLFADHLGLENIGGALETAGDYLGPTDEQEARQQAQAEARQQAVEDGELSRVGAFAADAGDATVQAAPTLASAMAGGAAGGAAGGSIFGPAGVAIGAALGAAAASFPQLYQSAKQFAEGQGLDTSDPEVQDKALMAAAVNTVLETALPVKIFGRVAGPGAARDLAMKSVAKRGVRDFAGGGLLEGMTEAGQLATEALMFDDELRSRLTDEDRQGLAGWVAERYGREAALAFVSGGALGGPAGAAAGMRSQQLQNAKLTEDIKTLATVAEPAGVQTSVIEEAARDPKRATELLEAASAIRTAESQRAAAQQVYEETPPEARDDPEHPVQQMLDRANRKADEVRDTYVPKFGGLTIAEMAERESKLDAETKSAAEARAAEIGIRPTQDVSAVDIDKVVAPLEEAKTERQQIEERLKAIGEESPKLRKKYEKELRQTRRKEIEAEIEARRVLTGADPDETRANIKYEQAVEAHRRIEFPDETTDPQATLLAADAVLMRRQEKKAETKTAEKARKRIDDLVERRRGLEDPSEIAKVSAEIAEEQAKLARPDPVAEAARRARQAALERLEPTDQSETDVPTAPAETSEVTEGPEATPPGGPALESEAQPDAAGEASPAADLPYEPERYFTPDEQTEVVPIDQLRPLRARPEGVANAGRFMREAYEGTKAKRPPISVRREDDGTYTVLDGNSTFANMQAAGWPDAPVRVLTDEEFAAESAPKFGKKTGTRTATEGATIVARGPERQRQAVEQRAAKEGLTVRFEPGSGIPEDDPRRQQFPIDKQRRWKDKLDELPPEPTLVEAEEWLTTVGPNEHGVAFDEDGVVLGAGTHGDPNRVGIPTRAGRVDVFTHNHPEQTPLSSADISTFTMVPSMTRMRAVLPDGQIVEAQRGEGLDGMSPEEFRTIWDERAVAIDLAIPDDITGVDRARLRQEAFLRHLDGDNLIVYTEPLQGLTAAEEEIVNGAVDAADAIAGDLGRLRDDAGARPEAAGQGRPDGSDRAQGPQGAPEAAGRATAAGLDPVEAYQPPAEAEFRNIETLWRGQSMARYPTINSILAAAPENNDRLTVIGQELEAAIPGTKFHIGPIKTRESIERKLDTKLINGKRAPAGRLADVVRGSIIVPTMRAANEVGQRLSRHPEIEVLDEGWNVTPYGYTDRKMTIRMPSGMMTELQVHFAPMIAAKEGVDPWVSLVPDSVDYGFRPGHVHYEVTRNPEEHTPEEVEVATQEQLDIYRGALELLPGELFAKALRAAPRLANASGNRSRQALSSITLAAPSSPGGVGSQPSPVNQRPAAEGGASAGSTAGSRSQLRNRSSDASMEGTPSDQGINPEVAIQAQNVDLRMGADTLERFGIAPGRTHNTRDIAAALEAHQRERHGTIERGDFSPEARDKIAEWMAEEVAFEADMAAKNQNSAVGWYTTKFQRALDTFAERYPELREGAEMGGTGFSSPAEARNFLTALIAIASDGAKVYANFRHAGEMYAAARETGVVPEDAANRSMRNAGVRYNIRVLNAAHQEHGAGLRDFLLEEVTVRDLNAALRTAGKKEMTGYQAHMLMPRSAILFGPKLGAFYANLSGATGYLTMDRWWSRTFNRYRGILLDAPNPTGMARVRQLIADDRQLDPDTLSDDRVLALATEYRNSYAAKNYSDGTEVEKAANTLYKAAFENLTDRPFNAKDRTFMIEATQAAQQRLAERGIDMTIADMQAVLWYYEKRLYAEMGARASPDVSYEEVARRVIDETTDTNDGDGPAGIGPEGADARGTAGAGAVDPDSDPGAVQLAVAAGTDGGAGGYSSRGPAPLAGAPTVKGASGPDPRLVSVAERYARENGIELRRQAEFAEVDPERAARIADAYEAMPHAPNDPEVRAAYNDLIRQVVAQYRALEGDGYQFFFFDETNDPYAGNPWNAMRDLRANKRMGVFATESGFGSGATELDVSDNPMLGDTGVTFPWGAPDGPAKRVLANDLFRAVHDAFGHGIEGAGFRARGEENAWQAHVRLFTGPAVGAITTETRGQNSWLNYGPYGEQNRTASVEETVFADQKTGLMPEWTWQEGRVGDEGPEGPDGGVAVAANLDGPQAGLTIAGRAMQTQQDPARAALRDLGSGLQPEQAAAILRNNALTPAQRLRDLRHRSTAYTAESAAALLQDGGFNGEAFRQLAGDHADRMERLLLALSLPERNALLTANRDWARDRQLRRTLPDGGNVARYVARQIEDGHLDERDFTARAAQLVNATRAQVRQFIDRGRAAVAANIDPHPGSPAPMYASRRVVDGIELYEWAIDAGIPNVTAPDDMHVTVAYSRAPVDPANVEPAADEMPIQIVDGRPVLLKDKHVVLPLDSEALQAGHQRYRDAGASHDYDDGYKPHVTLAYDLEPEAARRAVDNAGTFTGGLTLGPEHQEGLKPGEDVAPAVAKSVDTPRIENAAWFDVTAGEVFGVSSTHADAYFDDATAARFGFEPGNIDAAAEALLSRVDDGTVQDGFVDQHGKFYTRDEAAAYVKPREGRDYVDAEDLLYQSPAIAEAITVPRYLDVATEGQKAFQNALDIAKAPTQSARTGLEWVEDNIFNGFAPIRRLEMQVKGSLGIGMDSAYKAAEIATNDSGRNEALLFYGAAKLGIHGEFTVAPGTTGLRPIFDMAVEGTADKGQAMVDWMSFMVARRAQYLKRRGIKVPVTDAEISDALGKATPAFTAAADAWKAHNDANIDFLVDTGRITKAQADGMRQDDFYVPFYRTDKRVDGQSPEFDLTEWLGQRGGRGAGSSAIMARDPGIKKLVGGDKQAIDNLLNTMIRNSQAMAAAGMRNNAANKTFDLLTQAGLAQVTSASKRSQKTGKIVAKKKPHNSVRMWIGGKEKYVIVDEGAAPIVQAMAGLNPLQLGGLQSLMADIASIFRQGITLSPAFMIRNAIRGAVATGVLTSGQNLTLTSNTLTGFREALRKSDATQAFARISGMGDYRFGGRDVGFGDSDILIEYGIQPKTAGYRIRQALGVAEAAGTATELADRIAAFKTMQRNGIREDEAAYQALTVMNYGRRGGNATLRAFLPMVPFLNARLQGLSRLTEGAVGRRGAAGRKQAMMQLALNGGLLMLGATALWAWNNGDEERREKYTGEPLWRRQNYHIFYAGERTLMIPKAFELGHVFSSIPEMFLDAVANDMGDELDNATVQILGQTFGFNAIPAAVLPIIEGAANYSFFLGGPIEGRREANLLPRDRTENATALSKFVGRQLGISDLTRVSPTMIEHYLQGYGGAFYHMASAVTDAVGAELGLTPAPPAGAFGAMPVISPAMSRAVGSIVQVEGLTSDKYLEEFYRSKDHITQIYTSAKAAATSGDVEYAQRLLAERPGLMAQRAIVNKAAYTMGQLNTAIRQTKNAPNLSAAEKAQRLQPLIRQRNMLSRKVVEAIEKIEDRAEAA